MDFSYLEPSPLAHQLQHTDHYIKHGTGERASRKIYETVPYDSFETTKIEEFKKEIATRNIQLPVGWKNSDYLKILYSGRFKMKEVIKKLEAHIIWRNTPANHKINEITEKFLKDGICYTFGRDKQYRPVMILNTHQIDMKKYNKDTVIQALSFMMGIIRSKMFIPGKVENWIFILETNGIGVFGLPFKALGIIVDCMSLNFSGSLEKMYILNPSSGIDFAWRTIAGWLDEETRLKINFVTKRQLNVLLEQISADQLEVKYGGSLPDRTQFWPPYNLDLPDGYTKQVSPVTPQLNQDLEKQQDNVKEYRQDMKQAAAQPEQLEKQQKQQQQQQPQQQQEQKPKGSQQQQQQMKQDDEDPLDNMINMHIQSNQYNYLPKPKVNQEENPTSSDRLDKAEKGDDDVQVKQDKQQDMESAHFKSVDISNHNEENNDLIIDSNDDQQFHQIQVANPFKPQPYDQPEAEPIRKQESSNNDNIGAQSFISVTKLAPNQEIKENEVGVEIKQVGMTVEFKDPGQQAPGCCGTSKCILF